MSLPLVLLIWGTALLIEGLFSGSEIALVSASRLQLERDAKAGKRGARLALWLLEHSSVMLAITLIGTNIAVVSNTVVVTFYFLGQFGPKGELYALALLSPTILLFGEIVPKSFYQQHADAIAPKVSYIIYYARFPLAPLVALLRLFSLGAGQLLGFHRKKAMAVSREDLKLLIEEEEEGPQSDEEIPERNLNSIREGEREIIGNILSLRDTTAEEVMVPLSEVISAPLDVSLSELSQRVEQHGFTRIPIYKGRVDVIVGIVHSFDLLTSPGATIESIIQPPIFVPEHQKAFRLMVDLQKAHKGMSVVVNEYGGAVGIATIEDVLEEIVGEIEDEFDKPDEEILLLDEGCHLLSGRVPISRINEELELELEEREEYETVAGLLLFQLKRLPHVGETITLDSGVRFEVLTMTDRAILKVKMSRERP